MADDNNDPNLKQNKEEMDGSLDETKEDKTVEDIEADRKEADDSKEQNEDDEEESESEEDEELPPGLLEQPLEIEGKREKRKVERLSAADISGSKEKKKLEIEEGSGVKLGEIAVIEKKLESTKASDLKILHRLLFLRIGMAKDVKKNIRQFCGFKHPKESKEQEKRSNLLNKLHLSELKSICSTLGLFGTGTKKDVIDRIFDFLMSPNEKDSKNKKEKAKKSAAKSSKSKKTDKPGKGTKRKRTPKKKEKAKKSKDNDEDAGSHDDENDDDGDDEENDNAESPEEEESEDEAPKKKKAKTEKTEPKKKAKPEPKKKTPAKANGKKEKSPSVKAKKSSPKKKQEKKAQVSDDELSDISDSDDEPIANIKKTPPSNDEIKELVKKILDGADLEAVTMKTVVKDVYSKYPTFDLSDKKDFIKSTVREIIS